MALRRYDAVSVRCPLCAAKSRHERYSITSSARASKIMPLSRLRIVFDTPVQ